MPLIRPHKLPPPPELGEKTFWDYFPKRTGRRVLFLLIALGAVIFLKSTGRVSFGGLFDPAAPARPTPQQQADQFFRLQVKPTPTSAPPTKSTP